ncbi:MAG: hypothetical protein COY81_04210 [Candidatus Pacebacteria bacterium CG_4_10_14_0_8_um_filter_43_12]|nr:MAG: hypothetical protein COU66_00540 [Candidatus Pacebacteria bacterium CG10_big_fil_rev_8_21_14_0_10_44_11]PIY79090.1 MAG: hypothetical protein COY81_04210 [Candidatus Pacebacteria bacterium CG_4_10_14_0_8_um_filter_43_12]
MKKANTRHLTQNRWFIIAACVVIVLALIRQPSLKTLWPVFGWYQWQQLKSSVQADQKLTAQQLWQFREFYSRGKISLFSNQKFDIPNQISTNFSLPTDFQPYLIFESKKTLSLEGFSSTAEINSLINQKISADSSVVSSLPTTQIWQSKNDNVAYIVVSYSIPEAAQANGYLYFDLRAENFAQSVQGKQWLILTIVKL